MEKHELIDFIRQKQGQSSLRAFATEVGCSAAYLSDIYAGKREPGPKVLEFLGVIKQTEIKTSYYWKGE